MQEISFKTDENNAGMRLDLAVLSFIKENTELGISRTHLHELIKDNKISVNENSQVKAHYKLKLGDKVKALIQEQKVSCIEPEDIPLDIIYEDKDIAVINKPVGLVVHPAPGNYEHTLVNALLYHFKSLSDINPLRPGIVHRLDKETSGVLVIAKNNASHLKLAQQFSEHTIKRKYVAVVKGKVEFNEHIIELPIGRHPSKRKSMSVGFSDSAKYAKTYYKLLACTENLSLLELEPYTGRTHQLRVHLSFIGHPILGDSKYGKDHGIKRMFLHAQFLGFVHPRLGKGISFSSKVPADFYSFFQLKNKT